jgi:hypothetical protein
MSADKKSEFKQKLAETKAALDELLPELSDEQWQTVVIAEGNQWRVLEVVAHLVEAETTLNQRIERMRQGRQAMPPGYSIDGWNAGLKERMKQPTPETLLQGLAEVRLETLARLETIADNEWGLESLHPTRGTVTVEDYYNIIAGHQRWHLEDIRQGLGLT